MSAEPLMSNASTRPSVSTQEDQLSSVTDQLFQQLKHCLPIDSIEKIEKKLNEIKLGNHRLPLNIFTPFLSKDVFPIKSEEELQKKLSNGVRRGVALIGTGDIPVGKKQHIDVLATAILVSEGVLNSKVPVRNIFKF
ncbi:hypothetical protein [Mucilaginibacter sp.]|uniref:hypothetical protein n=1 Tax=Mucilaginibacter sp. TaxID=1882438 RepID=UPI0026114877|nr:hypothetical protein [Mucilaginibacter sp.]MDB4923211.1 hypothetical protein [Mucilaginibacter sp.]